jgi:FG-GAP-like repeat
MPQEEVVMPSSRNPGISASVLAVVLVAGSLAAGQGIVPLFDAPVLAGDGQTHFRTVLDYTGDGVPDAMSAYFSQGTMIARGYRNQGGQLVQDWQVTYPGATPGYEPRSLAATGDFDGDGREDLIHTIGQYFGIWLSNGAGVAPSVVGVSTEPAVIDQIVIADWDADGKSDFVFREGASVRFYKLMPGNVPALTDSTTIGPGTPSAARIFEVDVNGDGAPDLGSISAGFQFTTVVWLNVVSNGALQPGTSHPTISNFGAEPVAGDVDGDADEDIVLFGASETVVLRRTGASAFSVEAPVPGSTATSLCDLDHDGDLDGIGIQPITSGSIQYGAYFTVSWNDGTGTFPKTSTYGCNRVNAFTAPDYVAGAADLDGDGDPDLVAGNCVYYSRGNTTDPAYGSYAYGVRDLIDLDGDGDLDVLPGGLVNPFLATEPSVRVNQGDGSFGTPLFFAPPPPAGLVWKGPGFAGDFDGDGDADLLIDPVQPPYNFNASPTHFLANLGCGVFVDQGVVAATPMGVNTALMMPDSAIVRDLDGDGDLDLVAASGIARIWWNQGGTFVAGAQLNGVIAVADMNQDGNQDLVVLTVGSLGFVPGPLVSPLGAAVTIDPVVGAAAVADFDGDGDQDVFAVNSNQAKLWTNAGNGTFGSTPFPAMNPDTALLNPVRRVLAADVDGDGLTDVVSMSPVGMFAGMGILLHDGPQGTFGAPHKQVMQPAALADLDGDGDVDAIPLLTGIDKLTGRNLTFTPPAAGARKQYGNGTAGAAGIVPILGEKGPFRAGESCTLLIKGGLGGASGILALGGAPADVPMLGVTVLISLDFTLDIQLGGAPGVPGVGSFALPFVMPPSLAGSAIFKQAGFLDPSGPMGFSATNALRIDVGL